MQAYISLTISSEDTTNQTVIDHFLALPGSALNHNIHAKLRKYMNIAYYWWQALTSLNAKGLYYKVSV